ncbi:hypothetical protein GCM10009785_07860 [Brooklawnia cerclae]
MAGFPMRRYGNGLTDFVSETLQFICGGKQKYVGLVSIERGGKQPDSQLRAYARQIAERHCQSWAGGFGRGCTHSGSSLSRRSALVTASIGS